MNTYTWRQSGQDSRDHAFSSEGDFIPSLALENPDLGLVEYQVTACGYLLPLAYVMPGQGGEMCPVCQRLAILPLPRQPLISAVDARSAHH